MIAYSGREMIWPDDAPAAVLTFVGFCALQQAELRDGATETAHGGVAAV